MNQFFTTSAPSVNQPLEINGMHTLANKYKQAEKAHRRVVAEGFPKEEKFSTLEEIHEYLGGDRITCLLCGKSFKALCGHLSKIHKMSTDDYKDRYGLPFRSGLQIGELTDLYRDRGKSPMQLAHLASIRTPEAIALLRASVATQRTSHAKRLQTKENVKKSPPSVDHFTKNDAEKIIAHMDANDCSLMCAVRETQIMGMTCLKKMAKKFPDLNLAERMKNGSKGNRSPIKHNTDAIEKIKALRLSGMGFREIGAGLGIHEEYASLLHRRAA